MSLCIGVSRDSMKPSYFLQLIRCLVCATAVWSHALPAWSATGAQVIFFDNPGTQTLGTAPVLSATASSGLVPTFNSTTPSVCTITNSGLLTLVMQGTCTIAADQGGDASYDPAAQVSQSFDVEKALQSGLSVTASADSVLVGGSVTLSTTGGNGAGLVSYVSESANCTVSGNSLTGVAAGGCIVFSIKAGDAVFSDTRRKFGIEVVAPLSTGAVPTLSALTLPVSCGLSATPDVVDLRGGPGPAFAADMVILLSSALGQPLTFVEQGACGAVVLNGYLGGKLAFIPLKFRSGGDLRADGVYPLAGAQANGQYQVVRGGQSLLLAPALANVQQLLPLLPGVLIRQADNGVLTATLNGTTHAMQPGAQVQLVAATGTAQLSMERDGYWYFADAHGNRQILYPAFADPVALRNALQALDAAATLAIQPDSTGAIVFKGLPYTLVPEPTLTGVPTARLGQSAWQEALGQGGAVRYRVVNNQPLGTAQGLTVRP